MTRVSWIQIGLRSRRGSRGLLHWLLGSGGGLVQRWGSSHAAAGRSIARVSIGPVCLGWPSERYRRGGKVADGE